ncbi:MAG: hypothetical protein ACREOC_00525 [Gemmatimonadales bacterium]
MSSRRLALLAALTVVSLSTAACSDTTGPSSTLEPQLSETQGSNNKITRITTTSETQGSNN